MKTMTTFAIAVALGAAWSVAPAIAQTTTTTPPAPIEKKDTVGDKVDRGVDKTKEKAGEVKDKVVDTTKKTKDKVVDKTEKIAAKADRATVRSYQQSLKDKGYDPGPIDGIHGPRTSAAVREYQKKEGLTVTGRLDDDSMGRLSGTGTVRTGSDGTAPATTSPSASPSTGQTQIPAKQAR